MAAQSTCGAGGHFSAFVYIFLHFAAQLSSWECVGAHQVARDGEADTIPDHLLTKEMEEAIRSVRYHFDAEFLSFKTVRTS
jgi:hypothetical protein